jgi:hypothetical protein
MSKKIAIGIPTNRHVRPLTVFSLLELVAQSPGFTFNFIVETEGITVEDNRNQVVEKAIANKDDYLLFIDDDMIFPPDTLERLLAHGEKLVGTMSYSRHERMPTVKLKGIQKALIPKKFFECSSVGTGVLLIDMSLFEEISAPWFIMARYANGKVKLGEDVNFCEKAKAAGEKVWCDPSITIGHLGDKIY